MNYGYTVDKDTKYPVTTYIYLLFIRHFLNLLYLWAN